MRTFNNNYNKPRKPNFKERPRDGGLEVTVRNGDLEKALKIFKRKVQKSGLLKELKQKSFYEKPSEKKQRRKKEAVKRWRKLQKKLEDK
jgi:small subunit ribosomal protein S21